MSPRIKYYDPPTRDRELEVAVALTVFAGCVVAAAAGLVVARWAGWLR